MKPIKKILFAIDLSRTSDEIAPYAVMMQKQFDAEIHLIFVARAFDYFTGIYVPNISVQTIEEDLAKGAQQKITEFRDVFFKDLDDVQTIVTSGDISEEILAYVDSADIDMLVMGTHGRKGLDKAFFGSVAERVIKMAPVPVMVINPYRKKD